MKANDHTCSYYCERPACVLAQRNELRDKYVVPVADTALLESKLMTPCSYGILPEAPTCCCTEPPTKMGLTFYMDSSVGPVQRVDAKCPACGAMVKGLKL